MMEDRKLLEMARDALIRLCNEASGFLGMADPDQHGRTNMATLKLRIDNGREALAALNARLAQEENPALDLSGLAYELEGVVIDTEQGGGFDDVCLRTIKRVRDALWGVQPAIDGLPSRQPSKAEQLAAKGFQKAPYPNAADEMLDDHSRQPEEGRSDEYPNIEALLKGCVSGRISEWPSLVKEIRKLYTGKGE